MVQTEPFTECYDATVSMRPYNLMHFWPVYDVSDGDLVLIEINIVRVRELGGCRCVDIRGGVGTSIARMELRSVCMVSKRSG